MKRTLNYTNRRKIEQKDVSFRLAESADGSISFDADLGFDRSVYPDNASLYVEAYASATRQRYNYGTVGTSRPPEDTTITELDPSLPILFRVYVVDESNRHGLLLASGEKFRAEGEEADDQDRSSILRVKARPLGQLTWRLEFETGGMPELVINSRIPNAIGKLRADPLYQALILPAALHQVLSWYLSNGEDEEDNIYFEQWMAFASMFAESRPDSDDTESIAGWVNEVVKGFSEKFELSDRLVNAGIKES